MSVEHNISEGYEQLGDYNEVIVRCICDPTILAHYQTWPDDDTKQDIMLEHLEQLKRLEDARERSSDGLDDADRGAGVSGSAVVSAEGAVG